MTTAVVPDRTALYFDYRVERGCFERWGPLWSLDAERVARIEMEKKVIHSMGFENFFLMLSLVLERCDEEGIPVGPGRGSVGGSACCYALKIHDVDPLEYGLYFERFMNPERVEYPDVDIDLSQRHRPRVLEIVRELFQRDGNAVFQVAAFNRLGGRSCIDAVMAALAPGDDTAGATAENLKKCLPKGNITMGTKQDRELEWWLENGHGDRQRFREIAEQAGWMDYLTKLDSLPTNLARHAAGVVILGQDDVPNMPQTGIRSAKGAHSVLTGYDMYALGALDYVKYDFLGLRTLDVVSDADKLTGGDGSRAHLIQLWRDNREDPRPYKLLQEADTLGIFQMETDGYRRTLRDFQPTTFDHVVHLGALYRPGALDFKREDGKNMVEVYIERMHGREAVSVPGNDPILFRILADATRGDDTQGIILFQEQAMRIAVEIAGFSVAKADALRKAIGKKRLKEMDALKPEFIAGAVARGYDPALVETLWENIAAAARYSWNKSHAVFYGIITWLTAWFKAVHPGAFFTSLTNSFEEDKERQAEVIAEARQTIKIKPPDINVAQADFGYDAGDEAMVFGLNGIKGMGAAYRDALLCDRIIDGPYTDFEQFCGRVGGNVPSNIKKALLACGAFESLGEDRAFLLAETALGDPAWRVGLDCGHDGRRTKRPDYGGSLRCSKCRADKVVVLIEDIEPKLGTVADLVDKNSKLRTPRDLPPVWDVRMPSEEDLAAGELESIGFYISTQPLAAVNQALARLSKANHFGGKISGVKRKIDRKGGLMAMFTIMTPSLNKQRCTIFASVYPRYEKLITEGRQVLLRGAVDGSSILVDAVFEPDDARHFKVIEIHPADGETIRRPFHGDLTEVLALEAQGNRVRLL